MRQKYRKHTFVKIADDLGPGMSHFKSGCLAIVCGTYSQEYGGPNVDEYGLFWVDANKRVTGYSAWYHECQITACESQDIGDAEQMVEDYRFKIYRGIDFPKPPLSQSRKPLDPRNPKSKLPP